MKTRRDWIGIAGILVVVLTVAILILYAQKTAVVVVKRSTNQTKPAQIDPEITPTFNGSWGDFIAFGQKGEVALVGSTSILISNDGGKEWRKLSGGMAHESETTDGGVTTQNSKESNLAPRWVESKKLCSVEGAQIMSESGRLFISSTCDHSAQLWSVPLKGQGDWFVWYFLPKDESGRGFMPDAPFKTVGNRILIRALTPQGAIILTTDDDGNTWYPFWKKRVFELGVRDFSFVGQTLGWILKGDGTLIKSNDGGQTWFSLVSLPNSRDTYSIAFLDEWNGFVVGAQGLILNTNDGGKTWSDISVDSSIDLHSVIFDKDIAWVSGHSTKIFGINKIGEILAEATVPVETGIYSNLSASGTSAFFVNGTKIYRFSVSPNSESHRNY